MCRDAVSGLGVVPMTRRPSNVGPPNEPSDERAYTLPADHRGDGNTNARTVTIRNDEAINMRAST